MGIMKRAPGVCATAAIVLYVSLVSNAQSTSQVESLQDLIGVTVTGICG